MKWINVLLPAIGVFLAQFFLVDFLSLNMIRPDFLVVYVFYISLVFGKTPGVVTGFILGLLSDLSGVGSFFGLAPLTLSVTAYFSGYLTGKYERLLPYVFHGAWILIVAFHFLIISFVRFQTVFVSDPIEFWIKWLFSFSYTMMFFLVTQFFYPVREASRAEIT
ncbi:MAG: rod shape-determining protein MreD [Candidatus Marinimicrobia bacterium]|mgnify:CR=1 FL=1|jgi:rod shape-determining protein MreD|nr:rod shape-determining protein MreD [Candidatus Neomarinimicrobiota bacterium]|tara:strand:- start:2945 stop:3436 length:492 start_codon:yes stop_codon:yes gene_type:complete